MKILSKMFKMMAWQVECAISEVVDDTFRWNQDRDGDIVFSVAKRVHFTKYDNSTLVRFGKRKDLNALPKHVHVEEV